MKPFRQSNDLFPYLLIISQRRDKNKNKSWSNTISVFCVAWWKLLQLNHRLDNQFIVALEIDLKKKASTILIRKSRRYDLFTSEKRIEKEWNVICWFHLRPSRKQRNRFPSEEPNEKKLKSIQWDLFLYLFSYFLYVNRETLN